MSIPPSTRPSTRRITAQLSALGVEDGGVLLVHASLRAVGGRALSVLRALRGALGPDGTLVVPAFTPENSDTSPQYRERIRGLDAEARRAVRAVMPPYDPATSAAPSVGRLAETVRLAPGARRSAHPQTSFAALGREAGKVVAHHRPDCHLGEHSPLGYLYDAKARVLLLGTGFDTCSAFHLGEYRVPDPPRRRYRCVVAGDGPRRWWEYEDVALDDSDFAALGADFERAAGGGAVRTGPVGSAYARLFPFTDAVDFATRWLRGHRRMPSGAAGPS
ncbi:aminoglycoside N(3)-acetyltransferase [Streptomyces sp. DT24]|uniref:aminoglycoside N(3)-acetyltransferase n=1 Tax=unclassified Streptomyces TaxID=2593676 RepID=UPI0023B954C6|nr:AAC(3) family N-acetyltransferase [Streptomyces sp. AM 4-1-1]WEH32353.1 AAC(3) family N-acetyltransferase [Streptomyces sp. AM 4-1-1]